MELDDLFSLTKKVAIVTGAGSGLGVAFAEGLAEAGADVVCADKNFKTATETAEKIKKIGRKGLPIAVDVSKEEEVKAMVEKVVSEFARIDILFNNAGIAGSTLPVHEISAEDWNTAVSVNLTGVFLCSREVLKVMIQQKSGKIINLGSLFGLAGWELFPVAPYAATKGAVVNLTRELALEYAHYNINVNCIAPGFFGPTELAGGALLKDTQFKETVTSMVPMRKIPHPNELKGTAVFLASRAADFITGHVLVVDGGFMAK